MEFVLVACSVDLLGDTLVDLTGCSMDILITVQKDNR